MARNPGQGLLITAIALPALLCAAALLTPSAIPRPGFVAFYIAPFALGFLLWVRRRLLDSWAGADARLAVDGLAVGLSALRLAGPVIPPSGHMLFFVFSLLTTPSPGYRAVTLALIAETSFIKLVVWRDPTSWAVGILAGLVLSGAYFALAGIRGVRGSGRRPAERTAS